MREKTCPHISAGSSDIVVVGDKKWLQKLPLQQMQMTVQSLLPSLTRRSVSTENKTVFYLSVFFYSFSNPLITQHQIANVSRIMKSSVPPTAKIAKDAKECVQECVSEFISFITSEAAEKCQLEKRKTIGGEDILYAMATLGFDNYAETLKIHLAKLGQHQSTTTAAQAATLSTRELPQRDMDD